MGEPGRAGRPGGPQAVAAYAARQKLVNGPAKRSQQKLALLIRKEVPDLWFLNWAREVAMGRDPGQTMNDDGSLKPTEGPGAVTAFVPPGETLRKAAFEFLHTRRYGKAPDVLELECEVGVSVSGRVELDARVALLELTPADVLAAGITGDELSAARSAIRKLLEAKRRARAALEPR